MLLVNCRFGPVGLAFIFLKKSSNCFHVLAPSILPGPAFHIFLNSICSLSERIRLALIPCSSNLLTTPSESNLPSLKNLPKYLAGESPSVSGVRNCSNNLPIVVDSDALCLNNGSNSFSFAGINPLN